MKSDLIIIRAIEKTVICIVITLMMAGTAFGGQVEFTFKKIVRVTGGQVTLGDLVEKVIGLNEEEKRRILSTKVSDSPVAGKTLVLSPSKIHSFINYKELKLKRVKAVIPSKIVVTGDGRFVSATTMAKWFRRAVMDNLPWEPDQVVIKNLQLPERFSVPSGEVTIDYQANTFSRLPGKLNLKIEVKVNNRKVKVIKITGDVEFMRQIVVARKAIQAKKIISKSDLNIKIVKTDGRQKKYDFSNIEDVIGLQTRTHIRAGREINRGIIEKPAVVKRGDRVSLLAKMSGLTVQTVGIIKNRKAALGDQVRVVNLQTKREVYGTLIKPGLVQVTF